MLLRWFEKRVNPYPEKNLNKPLPNSFFAFIWESTEGIRPFLFLLILVTTCAASLEAVFFSTIGSLVDWLSTSIPKHFLEQHQHHLIFLASILFANIFCVCLQSILKHQIFFSTFPMRLRWRFHNLLLGQSLDFFNNDFAGRLSAKVMQSALAIRDFWMILSEIIVYVLVYFITISTILAHISLVLVAPLLLWLVLYIISASFFIPRLTQVAKQQANARAVMTGRVTDAYTNIHTVKLFAHAGRESQYAKASMMEFMDSVYGQMRLATLFEITTLLLSSVLFIGVIGTAIWLWLHGETEIGVIAAATAMIMKLNSMSEFMMFQISMLFENIGTIQDGMRSLTKPIKIKDKDDAVPLQVTQGQIEFQNVTFAYQDKKIIHDFNFTIRGGEKIGIVGRSGAGKSTLIQLLLRFYNINQGKILIDGQNIDNITQDSLRANIALVSQDTSLLHRSVADNIKYGKPDASLQEIDDAVEKAQASHFIPELTDMNLRQGYDAYVGDRGVKLSGGQRQRISIARVFLKNAPILILDEATSALDSEVEAAIQSSLDALMKDKTVIAIAHRLSTIAQMDRLIVLDQGQIIEQGTHAELLAKNGLYAQLWHRQTGDFLP